MRANAGTFGRLWDLMNRENGLRAVRNLGAKSEAEIFALSVYYLSDAIVYTANGASELFYWNKKSLYPTTGGRAPIARRPASGWLRK